MKLTKDRILCKPLHQESTTKSGIIIPTTARPSRYEVVQVDDTEVDVKAGQNVVIPTSGVPITINNVEHFIFRTDQIELVYEPKELI